MKQLFEQEAPVLARQCGLRERSISLVSLIYILVLGWWKDPKAGPSALARFANSLGGDVCKQDVDSHFTERTATFLLAVLRRAVQVLVCAESVDLPLLKQFTAVLVEDGSSISLPSALKSVWRGCGGSRATRGKGPKNQASLKITVRWDLLGGGLEGPYVQEGRRQELSSVLGEQVIAKGALWLADLGYWSLRFVRQLSQQGSYFLMRLKEGTIVWFSARQVDVLDLLPESVGERVELRVDLGMDKGVKGVRLLAERVPAHVVEKRHARLREEAQDHGKHVSEHALKWAQWTILITNVPAGLLTFEQALALQRARWQIELLFKLWKQYALIDEWHQTLAGGVRGLCQTLGDGRAPLVRPAFLLG